MNVRNNAEKPEKMEKKVDAPEEKGEKNAVKAFGKYFAAGAALVATLALPACGMDPMGRRTIDIDATADVSHDSPLEGIEDTSEMDGESDVPEEVDVPDVEMDVEEDTVADVEEDVVEDTGEDVSEDVESEDVSSEDAVEEDVSMDTGVDTESDTGVDTVTDTVDATDVSVDDVSGEDVVVSCDAFDDAKYSTMLNTGFKVPVGGVDVRYDGLSSGGNALFTLLCSGTVIRSGIEVAAGSTHTEDVTESSVRITLSPTMATASYSRLTIIVDAY